MYVAFHSTSGVGISGSRFGVYSGTLLEMVPLSAIYCNDASASVLRFACHISLLVMLLTLLNMMNSADVAAGCQFASFRIE